MDLFNKKKLAEHKSKIFDLERALFESQQYERIASEKLEIWVEKYYSLLIKYKQMTPEETKVVDADVAAETAAEEKVAEDIKTVEADPTVAPVVEEPVKVDVVDAVGHDTVFVPEVVTPVVDVPVVDPTKVDQVG
jgi:hypothetical protein